MTQNLYYSVDRSHFLAPAYGGRKGPIVQLNRYAFGRAV